MRMSGKSNNTECSYKKAYLLFLRPLRGNPQYSMQNLNFVFTPTQLIQNLQYDKEHKTTLNFINFMETCIIEGFLLLYRSSRKNMVQ